MQAKWMVYTLVLTMALGPFAVNTSNAGGGGSCSGEDEKQCLAVVFGTAAVLLAGVYLVARYSDKKNPETQGNLSQTGGNLPMSGAPGPVNEKHVRASPLEIKDRIAQNGDIILYKW